CKKMDDYLKYTGGKEILYTGKVDSVRILSGKNRVVITGLLMSDPKISRVKIYWNTKSDSLEQAITRTAGVDTLAIPIELPEGRYNFEIITYDNQGNPSVKVNASGTSYGAIFQESLSNRAIKVAEKTGDDVRLDMYSSDGNSPFTRVTYTGTDDEEHIVDVADSLASVVLKGVKALSKFKYQSYFLPDTTAIDTFMAEPQTIGAQEDITSVYIKNAGRYMVRGDNGNGKWGTPKDWLFNSAATNQNGGTGGGWSWDDGGVIHFETKDWGGDGVNNGKVWQTFTLPAGTYTAAFESGNCGGDNYTLKEIITEGTTLPDVENLGTPLAIFHGDNSNIGGTHNLTFTLDEPKTVSLGWVAKTGQYTYLQFRTVRLKIAGSGF
ncbi:MAG: DUF5013 domain-containing protein, partial [Sphingobacteriaceae bacterium]